MAAFLISTGDKMQIYHVDEDYVKYLRRFDEKVTIVKDKGKQRPYVGIVYNFDKMKYFAPFSSPEKDDGDNLTQEYRDKYSDNSKCTYEQIEKLKYGTILINNMIPISENQLISFDIDKITDENYKTILKDQFIYCNDNKDRILKKAKKLYKMVTTYRQAHFVSVSCNFKFLEQKCLEYESINKIDKVAIIEE